MAPSSTVKDSMIASLKHADLARRTRQIAMWREQVAEDPTMQADWQAANESVLSEQIENLANDESAQTAFVAQLTADAAQSPDDLFKAAVTNVQAAYTRKHAAQIGSNFLKQNAEKLAGMLPTQVTFAVTGYKLTHTADGVVWTPWYDTEHPCIIRGKECVDANTFVRDFLAKAKIDMPAGLAVRKSPTDASLMLDAPNDNGKRERKPRTAGASGTRAPAGKYLVAFRGTEYEPTALVPILELEYKIKHPDTKFDHGNWVLRTIKAQRKDHVTLIKTHTGAWSDSLMKTVNAGDGKDWIALEDRSPSATAATTANAVSNGTENTENTENKQEAEQAA